MNKEFNIILCRLSAVFVLYIAELGKKYKHQNSRISSYCLLDVFCFTGTRIYLLMTNCHRTLFNSSIWFLSTFHLFSRSNIEDFKNEFNNVINQ